MQPRRSESALVVAGDLELDGEEGSASGDEEGFVVFAAEGAVGGGFWEGDACELFAVGVVDADPVAGGGVEIA